jgi:hypothetical protein
VSEVFYQNVMLPWTWATPTPHCHSAFQEKGINRRKEEDRKPETAKL